MSLASSKVVPIEGAFALRRGQDYQVALQDARPVLEKAIRALGVRDDPTGVRCSPLYDGVADGEEGPIGIRTGYLTGGLANSTPAQKLIGAGLCNAQAPQMLSINMIEDPGRFGVVELLTNSDGSAIAAETVTAPQGGNLMRLVFLANAAATERYRRKLLQQELVRVTQALERLHDMMKGGAAADAMLAQTLQFCAMQLRSKIGDQGA